ncbi:MAG: hypothetical protein LBS74_04280 [Oscillospiraceae bacterium]|nr:hypothetical protein [Oscillospiraceae bacterium]
MAEDNKKVNDNKKINKEPQEQSTASSIAKLANKLTENKIFFSAVAVGLIAIIVVLIFIFSAASSGGKNNGTKGSTSSKASISSVTEGNEAPIIADEEDDTQANDGQTQSGAQSGTQSNADGDSTTNVKDTSSTPAATSKPEKATPTNA